MAEGMLKTAPQPEDTQEVPKQKEMRDRVLLNGIPIDMMDYFNVHITEMTHLNRRQMQEIYQILGGEEKPFVEIYPELSRLERKVGQPSGGETRYGKIWHYLKMLRRVQTKE
jgi:hypothetical protein